MTMTEPQRQGTIVVSWSTDARTGPVGRVSFNGEHWASVEWSEKRQRWCVEDVEGRCLTHTASIRGMAESKDEAVALAEAMIRDGRMPSPLMARAEADERRREEREKRAKRPSEQRRRAEREVRTEAMRLSYETERRDKDAEPIYEALDQALHLADLDLWKSNSFASMKPRLILHVEAAITRLTYEKLSNQSYFDHFCGGQPRLDRALAIYRKLTGVEYEPKQSEMSRIMGQIKVQAR
jgi:hypothetical protein